MQEIDAISTVFFLLCLGENHVWRQRHYLRGNTYFLQCRRVEGKSIKR